MIEKTGNDLVVIASNPQELAESQNATIERVNQKLHDADIERRQAQVTLEAATRAGLSIGPAKAIVRKAEQRVQFISKVRDALEAGYVIVPNFPGETIAIRVKRKTPRFQTATSTWRSGDADARIRDERPDVLPTGEGRYVKPQQLVNRSQFEAAKKNEPTKTETVYQSTTSGFDSEIGLRVEFLRPTVVERTGKCMTRKIFDEIAISGNFLGTAAGSTRGDPMVIGRIFDRSRNNRPLSFLIAWFVDTATI